MARQGQRGPLFDRRTFLRSSTVGLTGLGLLSTESGASTGPDSTHDPDQDDPVTIRDLRTADKPVRDVRAHGAIGDGEADDTAAIQAALDGALDGDVIYFPPGNYRCTEKLTQAGKALSLRGEGVSVSEITFDTADGGVALEVPRPTDAEGAPTGDPPGAASVSNLSLITTHAGGGTALDISWPFIGSSLYFHTIVRNVALIGRDRFETGWTDGIVLTDSWHTFLDGIDFVGAGQDVSGAAVHLRGRSIANVLRRIIGYHAKDGVLLNGRTEGFRLSQSDFVATTYGLRSGPEQHSIPQVVCVDSHANVSGIAVKLRRAQQVSVSGCDLWTWQWVPDDHTDPVITLEGTREARLTDNALIANAGGIELDGCRRTHVGGNAIKIGSEKEGVRVVHSENTTVASNQIWAEEPRVDGIVVDGGEMIAIVGNTLVGTDEGIRFTAGVEDAIAGFNLWKSFAREGVTDVVIDEGANTLVAQNLGAGTAASQEADQPDDGEEPSDDDEAAALPGFGVGAGAVGVGGVAMVLAARRSEEEASD